MPSGLFTLKQQILASEQGAWSVQKTPYVDYLVVAGGGAGGGTYGSGGGAGGMLSGTTFVTSGSAITVTIGAGGAGVGNADGNSGASSVFGSIAATGGGYGIAGYGSRAGSGGSGGGSGGNSSGSRKWGEGVLGQGNRGGTGMNGTGPAQGGGGGAGTAGGDGYEEQPAGYGGNGLGTYIGGALAVYAGGGGGGTYNASTANKNGLGGTGGGGNGGSSSTSTAGSAGTANTGGGGGGASYDSGAGGTVAGGNGGSGIVIISYPDIYQAAASTTGSPTVSTSGSGSLFFNAPTSSDGVVFPVNTALAPEAGDFCVEFFVYMTSVSSDFTFVSRANTGSFYDLLIQFRPSVSQNLKVNTTPNSYAPYDFSWAPVINTWYHIAVTRSGTNLRAFVNGTQIGSTQTDSQNMNQSVNFALGFNRQISAQNLSGYLSNFRFVKGSAVYTANFSAPTSPLTAIANTQLLINTVSGSQFLDSSSNSFVATLVNTPAWNQLSPFATGLGYKNRVYTWTSSGSITF